MSPWLPETHYNDVIMGAMASQITSLTIVCSTVYSGADQKKTSKLPITGLCEGNSPVTGEFPSQRSSNTEHASIWWRHHGKGMFMHFHVTDTLVHMYIALWFYLFMNPLFTRHKGVIAWRRFPLYWPFVSGIHRWPGQQCTYITLLFSAIQASCLTHSRWFETPLFRWFFDVTIRTWRHFNCKDASNTRMLMHSWILTFDGNSLTL